MWKKIAIFLVVCILGFIGYSRFFRDHDLITITMHDAAERKSYTAELDRLGRKYKVDKEGRVLVRARSMEELLEAMKPWYQAYGNQHSQSGNKKINANP